MPGEFLELYSSENTSNTMEWLLPANGSLIIPTANPKQSGKFLCTVTNGIGQEINQVAHLFVKGK